VLLIAHRTPHTAQGASRLAVAGAEVFEFDVQLGRAGEPVVSHYRPLPGLRLVERDNWRVRPAVTRRQRSADPTLATAMAALPEGCTALYDIKEPVPGRRAGLIALLPPGGLVSSPDAADLALARSAGLRTWLSIGRPARLAATLAAGPRDDQAVTVRHTLLERQTIARLHQLVPQVIAWTVNDVDRALRLRDAGVDGITTDSPDVLAALRP